MKYLIHKCSPVLIIVILLLLTALIFGKNGAVPTSGAMVKTVVLDAGHGEPDGGAVGKSGIKESVINLAITEIVKGKLEKDGFTVIMTRTDENAINQTKGESVRNNKRADLRERVRIANESGASALVSIHMNYFGQEKYSGPQVFHSETGDGKVLAEDIRASFIEHIGDHCTREAKPVTGGIYLLKNSQIPSVLVECGFLSNHAEESLLITKEYQQKIGTAIAEGIKSYFSGNNIS